MSSESAFDVIIVGGGPAGCATALALSRSNAKATFLLLDDAECTSFKIGESLPPEANSILRRLSPTLAARVAQDTSLGIHSRCTGNASIWESQDLRETFAIMNPFGMGWHLDRATFDESLRDAVRNLCNQTQSRSESPSLENQRKLEKAKFISLDNEASGWIVCAEELGTKVKTQYHSKWVVDATGRKASLAHKLGAKTVKADSLLAFYTLFTSMVVDMDHRTIIEAAEIGWWYSSQLPNKTRIVVYHTDGSDPSAKHARRLDGFLSLLYTTTEYISNVINENDYHPLPRSNFPRCTAAYSSFLEPLSDENKHWYAVGDAAIAFDPLSSQGMITALQMGLLVGMKLGRELAVDATDKEAKVNPHELRSVEDVYLALRKDYELKKKYFYRQARFDSDFWVRRW